jgi:integrase/recombinase XerC
VLGKLPEVAELSNRKMKEFVITARENGMKPQTENRDLSHLNSFLEWLLENHYATENYRIKHLKVERKLLSIFSEAQMLAIINYEPRRRHEKRMHAMTCILADTGIRVNEVLGLQKTDVDFENLLMKFNSKVQKERVVPKGF